MENRGKIEMIKNKYPVGTRIKLNYMDDNYSVPRGTCGTVEYVDDEGQIGMKWDNGSSLSLIYGVDSFITNKHWGCNGPLVFDARIKPHHAPPVEKDAATEKKIDRLFEKGGSLYSVL